MKSYTVPLPLMRFAGRSKITITFIVALAAVLTGLLITGFIFKEQKRQLESTQYRLKSMANCDTAIVHNLFDHYIDTLYKKADEASYIAKNSGKNLYRFVSDLEQFNVQTGG